jgi:hypothetical protein
MLGRQARSVKGVEEGFMNFFFSFSPSFSTLKRAYGKECESYTVVVKEVVNVIGGVNAKSDRHGHQQQNEQQNSRQTV